VGGDDVPEDDRIPVSAIPIGRRVKIGEVADAVMFFLSDNASAITGQVLGVNGGLSR
jgi:enoyl-[acyl-carrier-protein] reductase (NADH)